VKYENEIGLSDFSGDTVIPVAMPYIPHQPLNGPRRVNPQTYGTQMGVEFDPITGLDTGGAAILSYWLEIDSTGSGMGPFEEVGGYTLNSLALNYVITSLISGKTYFLRYRAKNSQGWSALPSPVMAILMSSAPAKDHTSSEDKHGWNQGCRPMDCS
jgi:hypothetical protein